MVTTLFKINLQNKTSSENIRYIAVGTQTEKFKVEKNFIGKYSQGKINIEVFFYMINP